MIKRAPAAPAGALRRGALRWDARPARARRAGQLLQINSAHSLRGRGGNVAIFLGCHCPARRRRVQAALRASLRDGFASLAPAPTRKDSAPMRKTGVD
jgi:hypothetical protein